MLLNARGGVALALAVALSIAASTGCGAKSGLFGASSSDGSDADGGDAAGDGAVEGSTDGGPCVVDADCIQEDVCARSFCDDGTCVIGPPLVCDDGDECTRDTCDSATGECLFEPLTRDEDGDGFLGPRPGFAAGAPGSCGNDCDDTRPEAFPGGLEVCDGVDNDCNGIVDDGAGYVPSGAPPVRLSEPANVSSGGAGLAWSGTGYGATYTGRQGRWVNFYHGLTATGVTEVPETDITSVNNDTFAGPLVWTGSVFGTVWEDRRDNNYEIYFNRLNALGEKLGPDVRISDAAGFSLHPDVVWNGSEYVVIWDDERVGLQTYQIIGRRVSADGEAIGEEVTLTEFTVQARSPRIAEGESRLGLVYTQTVGQEKRVAFQSVSPDLEQSGEAVTISEPGGTEPVIVWATDRYVVAWEVRAGAAPGSSIFAATVDEQGNVIEPARAVTTGASFARSPALIGLGDRALLVWADDADGNYELYGKMLDLGLGELNPRTRITFDPADTLDPIPAFGPEGDVGVVFTDRRDGSLQTYFARLVCQAVSGQ